MIVGQTSSFGSSGTRLLFSPGADSSAEGGHQPVLLGRVVDLLAGPDSRHLVDLTVGLGGHAGAMLDACGDGAELVGFDRDQDALELARRNLSAWQGQVTLVHSKASRAEHVIEEMGWVGEVDAVLADLGLSSLQLDRKDRGFSFDADSPLDMRMDREDSVTAGDLLDRWTGDELADVLRRYGEQPRAGRLARAILEARGEGELETCRDLARLVAEKMGGFKGRVHPATRVFQALRIAVNRELEELETILEQAPDWLAPGGRLGIISFHSLEDRMVKHRFTELCRPEQNLPAGIPLRAEQLPEPEFRLVTVRPVRPDPAEVAHNPRARSAKLRVLERRSA